MSYIELINRFWKYNRMYAFNPNEVCLFFYLLNTCNNLGWHSFRLSNQLIAAEIGITEARMMEARSTLINAGLIKFLSGRKKREPSLYSLTDIIKSPNPRSQSELRSETGSENGDESDSKSGSEKFSVHESELDSQLDIQYNSPSGSGISEKTSDIIRVIDKDIDIDKEIEKREREKDDLTAVAVPGQSKEIFEEYNFICKNFPPVIEYSKARQQAAGARLKEFGLEKVRQMLVMASESDFLNGSNPRNWLANFDWVMRPNNFVKILEGYYANRKRTVSDNKPSPLELIEETYNDLMNDGNFTD